MRTLLALCWMLLATMAQATGPDIDYFSKSTQFKSIKISPDGKHLAVLTPVEGKNVLAIMVTDTLETTYVVRFSGNEQVRDYFWANNERVIMSLDQFKGWWEEPQFYGQWYGVNYDGKKKHYIFGYDAGEMQTGSRIKKQQAMAAWGTLVDILPENDKYVLMQATPYDSNGKGDRLSELYRLNIYNGKTRKVAGAPTRHARFLTDHKGEARFVSGVDGKGNRELFYRKDKGDDWLALEHGSDDDGYFEPVAFADDNNVYLLDGRGGHTAGLHKLNLETGEQKLLFRDDVVSPTDAMLSPDRRQIFALQLDPDFPNYVFIRPKHPSAVLLKNLMAAFEGQQVKLISETPDGSRAIAVVFSDTDPGQFYLYDAAKNQMRHLAGSRPWVDPKQSSWVEPIAFESRDGMTIRGYLTLPPGYSVETARKLPLVVNPHGGPHARDWWGYDPETQMLASRGIAVLQVNFRGSTGYGAGFRKAGHKHWGDHIQHDIIDATSHIIDKGIADKERVCIYGGSFGAYSALRSAIIEPELFRCAVGFAGVYDLPLMFEEGDVPDQTGGEKYLERTLGKDMAQLKAFSPVHNHDSLTAPVLLIHGEEDVRAPMAQFERMEQALKARNHPLETRVLEKEGHGFYDDENRKEVYQELLGFLQRHLKL